MSGKSPPNIDGMVSIKVGNISYRTRTIDLHHLFDKFGEIGDVYIPRDKHSKHSRGFAFVRFYDRRDAEDALKAMDGRIIDGRELRMQMARYGRPTSRGSHRRSYTYQSHSRHHYSDSRSRSRSSNSRSRSRSRSRSFSYRTSSRSLSRSYSSRSRSRSIATSKSSRHS